MTLVKIKSGAELTPTIKVSKGMRHTALPLGLPGVPELEAEIREYVAVLTGHQEPPFDMGIITLMEVGNAYFARLNELRILILQAERSGAVDKSSPYAKIRTGDLAIAADLAKRCTDVGSRRLSHAQLMSDATKRGLDTDGYYDENDED